MFYLCLVISASGRGDRKIICKQLLVSCTSILNSIGERVVALFLRVNEVSRILCLCLFSIAALVGIINNTDNKINKNFAFIFNSFIDLWRQRYGVLV